MENTQLTTFSNSVQHCSQFNAACDSMQ